MRLRIRPKFWLIMLSVMTLCFGASFAFAQHSMNQGREAITEAALQRDALLKEVERLQAAFEFTQTDDYVIRVARDELSMIMPGEIRYINSN